MLNTLNRVSLDFALICAICVMVFVVASIASNDTEAGQACALRYSAGVCSQMLNR